MVDITREINAIKHMMNILAEKEPKRTLTARKIMRHELMKAEKHLHDKENSVS